MTRSPWQITDGVTSYAFAINPSSGGEPGLKRTPKQSTVLDGVGPVVEFPHDNVTSTSAEGTLLDEAQYHQMLAWAQNSNELTLFDDLGRRMQIVIQSLDLQRQKPSDHPWHHKFTLSFYILSVTNP